MNKDQERLYELKAAVLEAVAHPLRLAVIDFLSGGEQCVCDIARFVGAKRSNVSRHLGIMLRAGVLERRKDGLKVIYDLRTPCVTGFLNCVTKVLREQMKDEAALLGAL